MLFKKIPNEIVDEKVLEKLKKKVKLVDAIGKGHRGVVFKGIYNNKTVAVKIPRTDGKNTILNEVNILKLLEPYNISPKVYDYSKDYLIMEYIEGEELKSVVEKLDKKNLIEVIEEVLKIALRLDSLNIEHKEIKGGRHFLVGEKVYIIDFDKAKKKKTTKNFTSAIALLFGENKVGKVVRNKLNLNEDDIKFIKRLAKIYKGSV
ncbi:tyrosine protein kinase [Methanocaldococcus villosus KIN24-T80]|uniref:Tyrosine protein kinase n=1 Tax=Methanocaldococcus villosus KIN24-T80 TaxID=1069083 RepID=N6VZ12_9EURY|nr:protein kinase [Methanocaldococcus villosus]ENN96367.1 tyrosine protein kinase [Methanocaldococcus villosus KIN24-T80]